jgi:trehalose 6-phosphate phosphatase
MGTTFDEAVAAIAGADPARVAVVSDFDGVLAELTDDPADAVMVESMRRAVVELGNLGVRRAVLTGRRSRDVAALTRLEDIAHCGHYGAELLVPGGVEVDVPEEWARWTAPIAEFGAQRFDAPLRQIGVILDNSGGGIASFHYRHASDEAAALLRLREIAAEAEDRGMAVLWGSGLMEIRPPVTMTKREGMHRLLDGEDFDVVVYIGDTRPDIEGFRALREMVEAGQARAAVCIGVRSGYTPPELEAASDLMVDGVAGVERFLAEAGRSLALRQAGVAVEHAAATCPAGPRPAPAGLALD